MEATKSEKRFQTFVVSVPRTTKYNQRVIFVLSAVTLGDSYVAHVYKITTYLLATMMLPILEVSRIQGKRNLFELT